MKIIAIIMGCFLFCQPSFAQKSKFYLAPNLGLLNGHQHVSSTLGLTAAVANKQWVYGIGSSIDYYKLRSVPVFAEVKRQFGSKRTAPFVYANVGINFHWVLESQHQFHNNWIWGTTPPTCEFSNGHFMELGTGVNISNKKGKGLFVSLGYSSKSLSEAWTEGIWDPLNNEIVMTDRSKKYLLNRLVLKLGFRIF